jgi:hypothetical protein
MFPVTLPLIFAATALASPLLQHERLFKRACTTGPDTAADFLAYSAYSSAANNASTPSGYTKTFTNLNASNNADGYSGYTILSTYDVASCAAQCTTNTNCHAFNIFYERTPSPSSFNSTCSSTATIKCVFWNGPVTASNAVNTGSTQNNFEIVIAGSNGYIADTVSASPGYTTPIFLDNAAIQAPLDCNSKDTYLGFQIFTGPFNAAKCAQACSTQAAYSLAHPPSDGSTPKTCKFFNTFQELKNGVVLDQKCVLYSQTWGRIVATNTGYWYGGDRFTVGLSYVYSNVTDGGVCVKV